MTRRRLTHEQREAAHGVCQIGRTLAAPDTDTRTVLEALGLAPYRHLRSDTLPCGHPTSDSRRAATRRGTWCAGCKADRERARGGEVA